MGCKIYLNPNDILKALELSGFGFYHQELLNPRLASLLPERQEFGLRSFLNTIEKILNPFKTTKVLIGVTHSQFITKYIQIGVHTGFQDIFVIKGLEGGVEPFPDRETKVYTNKIFSLSIIPKDIKKNIKSIKNLSVKENADICLSVLKNEKNPFRDWALITAALIISAYELEDDIKRSFSIAEESLKSGAALECFELYRSLSKTKKVIQELSQ